MLNYKAIIVILLLIYDNLECGMTALTGQCNECFASGIACLAEETFARCSDSIPTLISTPCPTGTVCTADNNICVATAQGAVPVCYEDQCGVCASVDNNFACLSERIYALCLDGETPAISSITACPLDFVCDLQNAQICSPAAAATPSCVPPTTSTATTTENASTIESETDITTDFTGDTTPVTTAELSPSTASETSTDLSTETIADTTTVSPTTTSSDTTSQAIIPSTTIESTTETSTEITSEITTATTTSDTTTSSTGTATSSTTVTSTDATTTTSTTAIAPRDPNSVCADIATKGNFRVDGDATCSRYIHCYLLAGQYLGWEYTCRHYFDKASGKCQETRPGDC